MTRNLLIHSMAEFASLTLPILEIVKAKTVAEIGAEHGGNSKLLFEWLKERDGKLISIDPSPSLAFKEWLSETGGVVNHVAKNSHVALLEHKTADAWFIDGDHNWYTVYNELRIIRENSRKANQPVLIFLNDVSWPWGRRDLYYAPDQIPENFRHAFSWDGGVDLDSRNVIKGGFRSHGAYAIALTEGGPRNGVLTAVDDFTKEHAGEFCFAHVPAVFGLGVLFDLQHPQAELIAALVSPYHNNPLLQTLETNRLANYLTVIKWQDRYNTENNATASTASTAEKTIDNPFIHCEKRAIDLLNMLSDEINHPEIWQQIQREAIADKAGSRQFTDYLNMLAIIPQDAKTLKLISVLEAVYLAHNDNLPLANSKLEKLFAQYPRCALVMGAFSHVCGVTGVTTAEVTV